MMKKIASIVDIPTVVHAKERVSCAVACCLACRVCHAQIIIGWMAFRNSEDGNFVCLNWDLEGRGRGLLDCVLVVEDSCGACQ
jgi:hypothetical protein